MLHIETERKGDVVTLRLEGDIDEHGVGVLRTELVNCLRDNAYNVVLNMSGVKFISYMGVGILVERLRQFRSYNGDMKLTGLNLYTQRLFRMVGVTSLFDIHESEAAACRTYAKAVAA